MKSVNQSFANYLKDIRKSRKLTQEKLSELSYINVKTISLSLDMVDRSNIRKNYPI